MTFFWLWILLGIQDGERAYWEGTQRAQDRGVVLACWEMPYSNFVSGISIGGRWKRIEIDPPMHLNKGDYLEAYEKDGEIKFRKVSKF